MSIRIGTIFTGTVDQVGDESIQTKFFMIGVPLFPLESFFVLQDRGNGVNGFPIPLHMKSVLLAYLRWGSFIAAAIAAVMAFATPSYRRGPGEFIVSGVLVAVWVFTTFFAGRPSKDMVARRTVFKAATGFSATPDLVPSHVAREVHESLQKNAMPDNHAWRFVAGSYQAHVEGNDAARAAAEDAWLQLSGGAAARSSLISNDAQR